MCQFEIIENSSQRRAIMLLVQMTPKIRFHLADYCIASRCNWLHTPITDVIRFANEQAMPCSRSSEKGWRR